MPASPVFDHTCDVLERATFMDRLAARGTVRIALREAGLDAESVSAAQMAIVLRRVLPLELGRRGIEEPTEVCDAIAAALASREFEAVPDRAGDAAATLDRLGS
ncbi:MAG: hypothetical protein QNK05_17815 [Myxococcota bacterium]|nr:hypothetical protein [Myxococcota bacterium]